MSNISLRTWRRDNWYSRGYLPHYNSHEVVQSITLRLFDTLPQSKLREFLRLKLAPGVSSPSVITRKKIEEWLDSSYGECYLARPEIASLVQDALIYNHTKKYNLHAWVVMPNHIHFMISVFQEYKLDAVIKNFKSFTALHSNRILGRDGQFWFRDYFDRYIRNSDHYSLAKEYIEGNPVSAHLCRDKKEWKYSSASRKTW